MRLLLAAYLLLAGTLSALQPKDAPANMDTVRHAWTLLGWDDAKQARQWFQVAAKSDEPVTAYYGLEGIADSDARLGKAPIDVLAAYKKAQRHLSDHVLDQDLHKRFNDRLQLYQKAVVELAQPGGKWQGRDGRQGLIAIGEGKHGADKQLRLSAYECLGDRAWAGSHTRTAAEAASGAYRLALNQDPDRVERERLERKLHEAEAKLPGGKSKDADDHAYDQAGLIADPELLALMGRCGQCGGQGGKQRRACAEVAQAYTNFYAPGSRRPNPVKVKQRVKVLQKKLTDAGCF